MMRAILSSALAVAFVAGVSAQDKPNFAGTWKIDNSRSDQFSAGAPPLTITVEGNKMTISRTVAGNAQSTVLMTDGTPDKKLVGPPDKQVENTTVTKWEGNALVTTVTNPMMTRTDKRFIQEDGSMKIEITMKFSGGPRAGTSEQGWQVFNKVK